MTAIPHNDSSVAAASAVRPYRWRCFTPELLARFVLAAGDRESIRRLLVSAPNVAVGRWGEIELAEPEDVRVLALVQFLVSRRWRDLELTALCTRLLELAAAWPGEASAGSTRRS